MYPRETIIAIVENNSNGIVIDNDGSTFTIEYGNNSVWELHKIESAIVRLGFTMHIHKIESGAFTDRITIICE